MADAMLDARQDGGSYRRIEVITGQRRRRRWTAQEKARIVAESFEEGANISEGRAPQWRCPWAAHGVATEVGGSGRPQRARLCAGPDYFGGQPRDGRRAGPRCAGADDATGDGLSTRPVPR